MAKEKHKHKEDPKVEDVEEQDVDSEVAVETETEASDEVTSTSSKQPWFKRCWKWLATHKKISIPVAVLLVLAAIAVVPQTRYAAVGLVVKQSFPVIVTDAQTGKPVSSATVSLGGHETTTDNEGRASIRTKVGSTDLVVSKKYYDTQTKEVVVPIKKPKGSFGVQLQATGRPVPVSVVNKISKAPAPNITLAAEGTEVKTDNDGKATLVVPADKQDVRVALSGEGFNSVETALTVTSDEVPANVFELTPSGKLYFLSNASGKIDMIKSDLDGGNRQVVLAGTGKEDRNNTVLIASRDWKNIALLSKRDGGEYAKLFLIEADTDKLTIMDEGEASFSLNGWSGDRFIYTVTREKVKAWEPKRQTIKSYHAPTKKITALSDTAAEGAQYNYAYEEFSSVYILDEGVVFGKNWQGYYGSTIGSKQATFNSVKADGSEKKVVKSYPVGTTSIYLKPAEFGELYLQYYENNKDVYDEYKNGKITSITLTASEFYDSAYPRYVVSPSGAKTLWSEYRDGKNVLFVGDSTGENGKQIGASEDYTVYGWYTDDYILLTKKGSEMHIMPADGLPAGIDASPKVSDYYKPDYYNRGFGYGYGG